MTNLYVLDTNALTLLQQGHPKVCERAAAVPPVELAITVITVEEQLSGWYSELRQAKRPDRLAWAYRRLAENVRFLSRLQILDYEEPAIARCDELQRQKLKVRKADLQIAAIILTRQATLVTANLRDFNRVHGLKVEDWSK